MSMSIPESRPATICCCTCAGTFDSHDADYEQSGLCPYCGYDPKVDYRFDCPDAYDRDRDDRLMGLL